ncbi:MAG: 30S ribosomal protein S20 [Elusimicrobiota bacterium]|nr:30S ribosomal protein S20 [Endomicrobiia bacterium]MDW8165440.1 30S ribosomal protein S20 [Elusimicrobiota bacterium]
MAKLKTGRHTSALKELRKSLKRRARNLALKNKIKETKKLFLKAISEKKIEEAKKLLQQFYKLVDKAAKTHYFHKNKSSRLKSNLAKKLNQLLK